MHLLAHQILFINFRWIDAVDVFLVAVLLYQLYNIIKGTPAVSVFIGITAIYVFWIFIRAFDMKLFGSILGKFIDVGVIAIIVVFQQELRRFLLFIGSSEFLSRNNSWPGCFILPEAALPKNTQRLILIPLCVPALK